MPFPNQDRFHLASFILPSAAQRKTSFNAKTAPGVFIWRTFVMVISSVQMGAMRALMLAKTSVSQNSLRVGLSSVVTMTVAYS